MSSSDRRKSSESEPPVASDAIRASLAVQEGKLRQLEHEHAATPEIKEETEQKQKLEEQVKHALEEKRKLDAGVQGEQEHGEGEKAQGGKIKEAEGKGQAKEKEGGRIKEEKAPRTDAPKPGGKEKKDRKGKSEKYTLKTPKGTRDWTPNEMAVREHIFSTISRVFKKHGGVTIDTPVFELKEILAGKYGEDSKLIYDLQDQGGELCSLRYDLTVPFARFLAMNGSQYPAIKRYHIAKVYRRDQPAMSKGRMREFYQCDFDIAGVFDPMLPDSEALVVLVEALSELDVGDFTIKINHRKILDGIFSLSGVPDDKIRTISSAVDKLDKSPWSEVRKEMTVEKGLAEDVADRIWEYVQLKGGKELVEKLKHDAKLTGNESAKAGLADMELLFKYLDVYGVSSKFSFDLSLARGLDYYTGVIYEAVVEGSAPPKPLPADVEVPKKSSKSKKKDAEGEEEVDESQVGVGSIAAGGRYDNLVGMFAGGGAASQIPCVGVSIGVERVFSILMQRQQREQEAARRGKETEVYVMAMGDGLLLERMQVTKQLWDVGIKAEFMYKNKPKPQKQFETVDKDRIPFTVLLAPKEWADGQARIKEQRGKEGGAGEGDIVKVEDLAKELGQRIARWREAGGF